MSIDGYLRGRAMFYGVAIALGSLILGGADFVSTPKDRAIDIPLILVGVLGGTAIAVVAYRRQ